MTNKCIQCLKNIPDEWGKDCFCGNSCREKWEKENIKRLHLSKDELIDLWRKDDEIPRICENCYYLGSESIGDYCEQSWNVCHRMDIEAHDLKGFPFEKPQECFKLNFWSSHFVDKFSGVEFNDKYLVKKFWQNPDFKPDNYTIDHLLKRVIDAEVELQESKSNELSNNEDLIKEINGVIGCLDGNTLSHIRSIVSLLSHYNWAVDNLSTLLDHSNRDYALSEKKRILERLKEENSKLKRRE